MGTSYLKQGDTGPSITGTLLDWNGNPVDLAGATVRFHMREAVSREVFVDAGAVIVNEVQGQVRYDWGANDTRRVGHYDAEWEVTFGTGEVETFPSNTYHRITILEDVA